jgi:hypothetical protein
MIRAWYSQSGCWSWRLTKVADGIALNDVANSLLPWLYIDRLWYTLFDALRYFRVPLRDVSNETLSPSIPLSPFVADSAEHSKCRYRGLDFASLMASMSLLTRDQC